MEITRIGPVSIFWITPRYSRETLYEIRYLHINCSCEWFGDWHPLKGPCQEKTPLHRKKGSFFCRVIIQHEISPLSLPASGFSKFIGADSYSICYQAPIRIKVSERKSKN